MFQVGRRHFDAIPLLSLLSFFSYYSITLPEATISTDGDEFTLGAVIPMPETTLMVLSFLKNLLLLFYQYFFQEAVTLDVEELEASFFPFDSSFFLQILFLETPPSVNDRVGRERSFDYFAQRNPRHRHE